MLHTAGLLVERDRSLTGIFEKFLRPNSVIDRFLDELSTYRPVLKVNRLVECRWTEHRKQMHCRYGIGTMVPVSLFGCQNWSSAQAFTVYPSPRGRRRGVFYEEVL